MNKVPTLPPHAVLTHLKPGQHIWLFLDYDGTLADFAATPDLVVPDADLIRLLARLTAHPRLHTAIVSGRRLRHIEQLAPIQGMWLAGTYGLEIRTPQGEKVAPLLYEDVRPVLEAIKPRWQRLLQSHPDYYLEDKGWSLAIHARFVPEAEAESTLHAAALAAREEIKLEGLHLLGGHKFLEVCPKSALKTGAIEYILENDPVRDALPLYFGDDDKDEVAFTAIQKMGGLPIVVAAQPRPTKGLYRLESPAAVRAWLAALLAFLAPHP